MNKKPQFLPPGTYIPTGRARVNQIITDVIVNRVKSKAPLEFPLWHKGINSVSAVAGTWLQSPALPSRLKDPALLQLWHRSQLQLGFHLWLGRSMCHGAAKKKKKKAKYHWIMIKATGTLPQEGVRKVPRRPHWSRPGRPKWVCAWAAAQQGLTGTEAEGRRGSGMGTER